MATGSADTVPAPSLLGRKVGGRVGGSLFAFSLSYPCRDELTRNPLLMGVMMMVRMMMVVMVMVVRMMVVMVRMMVVRGMMKADIH